jgi:hypothetical protein
MPSTAITVKTSSGIVEVRRERVMQERCAHRNSCTVSTDRCASRSDDQITCVIVRLRPRRAGGGLAAPIQDSVAVWPSRVPQGNETRGDVNGTLPVSAFRRVSGFHFSLAMRRMALANYKCEGENTRLA